MYQPKDNQELLKIAITNSVPQLRQLVQPFVDAKEKLLNSGLPVFRKDIEEQFRQNVLNTIADDLAKHLPEVSPEDIVIVLEEFNLEEFLNC